MNPLLENEVENRHIERLSRLGILFAPMGYVDGANRYEFVMDNPVGLLDPMGTEAVKALQPVLNTTESIKNLDATIAGGTPYAEIAQAWEEELSEKYKDKLGIFGLKIPHFTAAGVQEITNQAINNPVQVPARSWGVAMRLFYITIPICGKGSENAIPRIEETWKQEAFDGAQWKDVTAPGMAKAHEGLAGIPAPKDKMEGRSRNIRIARLKQPMGDYDHVIIIGDMPNIESWLQAVPAIQQPIDIEKLSIAGKVVLEDRSGKDPIRVQSLNYNFTVGFDEKGTLISNNGVPTSQPAAK